MPNPEIGHNGLTQIFSEMQGTNGYSIAYNYAMNKYRQAQATMSPAQQYLSVSGGFDAQFNSRVTPYTFMVHSLFQNDPAQYQQLVHNLQQTPQGQSELATLAKQWDYANKAGLFAAAGGAK
jgi:hypothetical protein